jgi:hypothetical protein
MKKSIRQGAKKEKTETRIILNDSKETGELGLKQYGGFVNEAYNTTLYWPSVQPIYSRLRRSMPEIVMVRNAFTSWARNIDIIVDLPEKPTDDDKKYQDFIYEVFSDIDGGENGFIDGLVNYVPFYGWGWWEVVPGIRSGIWKAPDQDKWKSQYDDGLIGLRRIAWRDPSTFYGWEFDDTKHLTGMKQSLYGKQPLTIPLEKSLHMTYGDPNNPEGLSPLEAVWRLERIKFGLEVIQGIGFEHAAGYLNVLKTEGGELSNADRTNVKNAARAILTAQEGNYALWPKGISGKVEDIGFQAAPSLLEAIKYYSILTLSVYTMQWIALNTMTGTGALASAQDSSQMGVFTFNAMMDGFASQLDEQVGKRIYNWNKDSFPNLTERPALRFSHIDKSVSMTDMGTFLAAVKDIVPLGDDDLVAIRKRSGFLPETLPPEEEVEPEPPAVNTLTETVEPPEEDPQLLAMDMRSVYERLVHG